MFDGLLNEADEIVSLDRPSLRGLSYALRHPEVWPDGFEWDYRECESCAMGLAFELWRGMSDQFSTGQPNTRAFVHEFKMHASDAADVFFFQGSIRRRRGEDIEWMSDITPLHVAEAIDDYLASVA